MLLKYYILGYLEWNILSNVVHTYVLESELHSKINYLQLGFVNISMHRSQISSTATKIMSNYYLVVIEYYQKLSSDYSFDTKYIYYYYNYNFFYYNTFYYYYSYIKF